MRFAVFLNAIVADAGNLGGDFPNDPMPTQARDMLSALATVFESERYLLWPATGTGSRGHWPFRNPTSSHHPSIVVLLKQGAVTKDTIKAWNHALMVGREMCELQGIRADRRQTKLSIEEKLHIVKLTQRKLDAVFGDIVQGLETVGWDLETGAVETGAKWRVAMESFGKAEKPQLKGGKMTEEMMRDASGEL